MKHFHVALMNEHHVRPQEAGGSDSRTNKVWLCPTCHQSLHRISEMFLRGDTGQASDVASVAFPRPGPRARILRLASTAAEHVQAFEESTPEAARANKTVALSLDVLEYKHIKALASEVRGSDGRALTVPAYIEALVRAHLRNPNKRR